ncbi:MAG: hypothetical protein ACK4GK_09515 [Ferrovibrio sp.]
MIKVIFKPLAMVAWLFSAFWWILAAMMTKPDVIPAIQAIGAEANLWAALSAAVAAFAQGLSDA